MSLILSGTDGLSDIDGSAATPAIRGTDANTGIFFPAADTIAFAEGGAEVARFDSLGNFLVGTTTAQTGAKLAVTGGIQGTITSSTAVASTSGTSITFSSIPSWVKRITIMLSGVSTSGTANPQIQIGSGSALTTGYLGQVWLGNTNNTTFSTGFLFGTANLTTYVYYGQATLTNLTGNSWVYSVSAGATTAGASITGGGSNTTLGGVLDRVIVTTSNGTDTFDAGTVNIMYEG